MKKILVVDDNKTNLKILKLILSKKDYEIVLESNSVAVLETVKNQKPDLILLDITMPDVDGYEICSFLKSEPDLKDIPIIFVSALSSAENISQGLNFGAVDYITKPYKAQEVLARVSTHLKIRDLQIQLENANKNLEKRVQMQVKQIADAQFETIFALAKLAQSRDDDTGSHLERVRKYCYILSKELQKNSIYSDRIDERFIKNMTLACPLHDIGKVGISDSILLKPAKLTPEEFEIMKTHTTIGAKTLSEIQEKFSDNAFIAMGKVIAKYHHERWDGKGYPEGLKEEEIPLPARIMAIADVYDALKVKRVYKEPFCHEKCVEIIKEGAGTQFDPYIVHSFLVLEGEFEKISNIS